MGWLSVQGDSVRVEVLVAPRASRTRIVGVHDDRLKVQLNAPPVDGEANAALIALFAKALGLGKSDVTIASGATGRRKTLLLRGASEAAVRALAEGG